MATQDVRVVLDEAAIASVATWPETRAALMQVGERMAGAARSMAAHRTGAGAASIHPEAVGAEVQVSWDPAHGYMRFPEFGTRYMSAQPALGPAINYAHF